MALYYVAHQFGGDAANIERARKIARDLQLANPEHCVVCPLLNFSFLRYGELGYEEELEICIDLLSVCDVLFVASRQSEGVKREVEFAQKVGMEVVYLAEEYRIV